MPPHRARRIAALSLALVAAMVLATRPARTAQASAPALLILNKTDATLAIVDPATGAVVVRVPTGEGPHEVVVSSDGRTAFVANYGGSTPGRTLSVIDLALRKEVRRVDLSPLARPHGLDVFDGKVYFTAESSQAVGRYDPIAGRVDAQFATGQAATHMVVISPDGRHLFTANIASNTISIFDRGSVLGDWVNPTAVPVGRGPEGLDVSPDGRELWTAHSQDGGLSIIDVASRAVVATLDVKTKRSNRLKFTPDGTRVLVSDMDGGELVVIDARARTEVARVTLGRMVEGILVAPDGSRAYVAETGDDAVAIVDLKTLSVTGRIRPGGGPDGMAWAAPKTPGGTGGAPSAIRISLLNRPIGRETDTLRQEAGGVVLESDVDLTERGSRLQVHARLEAASNFEPRRFRSAGKTYRFVNVDVDWAAGDAPAGAPRFPAMGWAPLAGRAALIRYWTAIGRPERVAIVPGEPERSATIERRGTDTVRVGERDVRLTRYTVNGVVWGRETVWLDDQDELAALLTRIHILPLEGIREDLAEWLPRLQASAVQDQMEDLARLARETPALAAGTFAFVGARLIDGAGGPPVDDAVVVVSDGRIAAAGPRATVTVPRGARTFDARSKTIAPGLWDMHAHASQIEWAPAYLAAGVTSIRDMGGDTRLLTSMRDAIVAGHAVGPRMYLAGLVDGEAPGAMGAVAAATPAQGRAIVDRYKAAGFVQMKLYSMLQPDVIAAVTARAHELGMTVTGHVPNAVTLTRAVELGMDQIAHLPLRGDPTSPANRQIIAMLAERHIVVDPTLPWNELLGHAPSTAIESFEPGFPAAPPPLILAYRSVLNAGDAARVEASRRAEGAMVKALFDAGVPIVAGTDGAVPGVSALRALELYVAAGLTPMEAIQTATSGAARALGADGDVGTLAPGRRADLIVLDADPLADISNIRTLHWVVAAGRMYEPAAITRH